MKAKEITITIPEADASVLHWIDSQFDPSASFRHLVHEYIHASGYSDITCEDAPAEHQEPVSEQTSEPDTSSVPPEPPIVHTEKPEYPDSTSWTSKEKNLFAKAHHDEIHAFFWEHQNERTKNLVEPFNKAFGTCFDLKYIRILRQNFHRYCRDHHETNPALSPSMAILGKPEKDVTLADLPEYGKKLNELTNRCQKNAFITDKQIHWIDLHLTVCGYTKARKDYNRNFNKNVTAKEFHQICKDNHIKVRPKSKWTQYDRTLFNNLHRDEIVAFFAKDPYRKIDEAAALEFNTMLNTDYSTKQIQDIRYHTGHSRKLKARVHANWEAEGEKTLNNIKNDTAEPVSQSSPAYAYEK